MRQISRQPAEQRQRGGELREQAARRLVADLVARPWAARRGRCERRRGEGRGERADAVAVGGGGRAAGARSPQPAPFVLTDALRDDYLRLGGNAAAGVA
jgi:hypothetical protein